MCDGRPATFSIKATFNCTIALLNHCASVSRLLCSLAIRPWNGLVWRSATSRVAMLLQPSFADAAKAAVPLITEWFGVARERTKIADLPYADAAPFRERSLFCLTPLCEQRSETLLVSPAAHQLTHASFLLIPPLD